MVIAVALGVAFAPSAAAAVAAGPPQVTDVHATQVTAGSATLEATIDPEGLKTEYVVVAEGTFLGDSEKVSTRERAGRLKSTSRPKRIRVHEHMRKGEWFFAFWVEATNADGTTTSEAVEVEPPG